MFISPKTAIEEGWVKFPDWMTEKQREKCIQPNALDFTIDNIRRINMLSPCYIGEDSKTMRQSYEMQPKDGIWLLERGDYDFMSDFYVDIPEGVAVEVIARSTFVRNGIFITTGLWDSGFKGPAGGVLNVAGTANIQQHVRVGQLKFLKSEKGGVYAGGYNTDAGVHWQTTIKDQS